MSNVPQDVIDDFDNKLTELIEVSLSGNQAKAIDLANEIQRIFELRAQRSNAEPVYQVQAWDKSWVTVDKDSYEFVFSNPENTQQTRVLYTAPPDYDAGVAAGMMKAAERCLDEAYEPNGEQWNKAANYCRERILSAIPDDSKAALREVCMKVVKIVEGHYGYELLVPSALDNIINSVLEDKS